MTAPVCNIPSETPLSQGRQPDPKLAMSIPHAVDLRSALAAINAMRNIIYSMMGANRQGGTTIPASHPTTTGRGPQGSGPKNSPKNPQGRYTEVNRVEEKLKVPIVDEDNQQVGFADFVRINKVDMRDNVTGEIWTWNRNHG